ncbi:MAG TPA: PAS domain S-box protein [candidate division Zixibacteria bacterium]|nr:PAS domain S-box protein [candidate division Zixibacteria bacterium]
MKEQIRLLLIEDSETDAELILHLLKKDGMEVEHKRVQSARGMRTAMENSSWDVVISDYSMPRFDAIKAWEILKETDIDIPFIIVSGKIGEDTAVEAMRSGVHDYIMKDRLGRLAPAIRREIADAETRRRHRRDLKLRRRLEARYRMVVENAGEGIAVIQGGKFQLVNPMVMRVLDKNEVDLIGRPFYDFIHEEDRDQILKYYKTRLEKKGAPEVYSFRIKDGEGTIKWVENRVVVIDWEGKPATLNFLADISERKKTEDALRKTKEQLEYDRESLRKKNIALREVLEQIESEKENLKKQIAGNIETRVKNTLLRMKEIAPPDMHTYIAMLEKDLDEIASPFIDKLKAAFSKLSPRELEICYMIKNGMRSKEIAEFLNIAPATVNKHREIIRRKFELVGSEDNLTSFLQAVE